MFLFTGTRHSRRQLWQVWRCNSPWFVLVISLAFICYSKVVADDIATKPVELHDAAAEKAKTEPPKAAADHKPPDERPTVSVSQDDEDDEDEEDDDSPRCTVSPRSLAQFANREAYDLGAVVKYVTKPSCVPLYPTKGRAALKYGISLDDVGPVAALKFKYFADMNNTLDDRIWTQTDQLLAKQVPSWLRTNNVSNTELYPVLGKLAILSPEGARIVLGELMVRELSATVSALFDGDKMIEPRASELSRKLIKLGASDPKLMNELAGNIEQLAVAAQANLLRDTLTSLAVASWVEEKLTKTYELSVAAMEQGVKKGKKYFSNDQKNQLLRSIYAALTAGLPFFDSLESTVEDFNQAFNSLLEGNRIKDTSLAELWKKITRLLAEYGGQDALAQAVGISLGPDTILLPAEEREVLLKASKNYEVIALGLQLNFTRAVLELQKKLANEDLSEDEYRKIAQKYFLPYAVAFFDYEPMLIDGQWLSEVTRAKMVSDDIIEKKFPKLVLDALIRREKGPTREVASDIPLTVSMAEDIAVTWALVQTQIPTLLDWVKRQEAPKK